MEHIGFEAQRVATLLRPGAHKTISSVQGTLDLVHMIEEGLSVRSIELMAGHLKMAFDPLVLALGLAPRTIARRRSTRQALDSVESERVMRLARVFVRACDVLGAEDKAVSWLQRSNRALANHTPLELMKTDLGAEEVLTILGRIEHGVFG